MKTSDFLRRQAEFCLSISRSTFDLTTAGRLRAMAAELRGKASELDEDAGGWSPHMIRPHGSAADRDRD